MTRQAVKEDLSRAIASGELQRIGMEGDTSWQLLSGDVGAGAQGRSFGGGLTREEVKAELEAARVSGQLEQDDGE